jgi:hypothetical protein
MRPSTAPTNRLALLSFTAAGLTLTSFCAGVVPIPLTAWICYPIAVLFGSVALLTGFRALRQVRVGYEKGRGLALLGMWIGGLTLLAVLCFTTLSGLVLYYGSEAVQTLWLRFKP